MPSGGTLVGMDGDLSVAIGKVMGDVLVRGPLAAHEDFFECGGDSLRAIEVLQRLATENAGVRSTEMQAVLLEGIFDDASPAGLASVVSAHA